LPPGIAGQLEGLLARFKDLAALSSGRLAELETLLQQTAKSADLHSPQSFREQLGFLSLLFGFLLERNLLQSKQQEPLNLLQQALLRFRNQLAGKGDEALQRLELLHWCRDRLADEQVQFIPLPFSELEEGYLLIREQDRSAHEVDDRDPELQLSMALRLSALGSVRVDLLYGPSGLRVQLAGEGREKMVFLEKFGAELERAMTSVRLLSLGFRDDARQPTSQLKKRVLPASDQLLNTRA